MYSCHVPLKATSVHHLATNGTHILLFSTEANVFFKCFKADGGERAVWALDDRVALGYGSLVLPIQMVERSGDGVDAMVVDGCITKPAMPDQSP